MSGKQLSDSLPVRLELKNLCVEVSETFRLEDIHLSLIPGHVHILMGENGSGKSSLIHAIAGNLKACG
ncbi:MAG: ATP-binding cassette domain-containing protein, partial [Clostridia bacterium]|nr:ATP-binding cassette domain-containing protein [Clostridia bacterium]